MFNKGGFSWRRLLGITWAIREIVLFIGIPFTQGGRDMKIGRFVRRIFISITRGFWSK